VPTGTVKFFNHQKGYGFISRPDGGSPARTDRAVTATSRRLNAPYMLGR